MLLAGPSGSGKGRVGDLSGLPVVNLDDFYREHTDRGLPQAWGIIDWDHPASWRADHALAALVTLAHSDSCEVPTYSITKSERTGIRTIDVTGAPLLIAEGVFASELVEPLRARGLLADAIVLDRPAPLVFGLRFVRDVRQSRKSIPTLVRRGAGLAASQGSDVSRWARAGMRRLGLRDAVAHLRTLSLLALSDTRRRPSPAREPVITVSAVCFVHREPPGPGLPNGDWRVLGVRKRGTTAFMQPGGKPEVGENPVQCAIREVKEELAVTLDRESLVSLGHVTTRAANEANTRLEADLFLAPTVHNPSDFGIRAEIEELRWFSLSDLNAHEQDPALIAPLFRDFVVPELLERLP